jgi:hypothetical protein
MNTPHLLETLLAGLVFNDEACACYPELGAWRARVEADGGIPLQWVVLTDDLPLARGLLWHLVGALLDLLEAAEEGGDRGQADGCALWHTLSLAPPWLLRPDDPDDVLDDIALLLECDEDHGGDWNGLLESLHQAGSLEWQWAIHRCRAMQRFEREQGVNLRALLDTSVDDGTNGQTASEEERCAALPPTASA